MSKNNQHSALLKEIWQQELRPVFFGLLTISLFINLLALAVPIFVLQVYDRVVFHAGVTTLQGLVIGMALVLIFDAALKVTRVRSFQLISARNEAKLTERIFKQLFALPLKKLEEQPLWYWQSLFQDANLVRNVLGGATAALILDLPFALLFMLLTFLIAPPLAWLFLLALVFFIGLAIFSQHTIQRKTQLERQSVQQRETMIAGVLAGRETVKMFDLGNYWQDKQRDLQLDTMSASMARGQATDYFRIISQSTSLMFTVTLTSVGALAILEQEMTIGALIAANMLGSRLIAPFIQLVEHWRTFAQFHKALNRLNDFFKIRIDKTEHLLDLPVTQGKIQLQELYFSYDDQQNPAIAGLDGVIGPNGLHLLMGRNGSGKSTLLKLVSGLYLPAKGKVSLDQADLRQFSSAQLHQYIGYLPQKIELFHGSIYENITMGMDTCDQDDVIKLAQQVQLHELVTQLPMGYETMLQEGGRGISGGLLQKIALARTLIRKPKVLLLDEPTNNLDSDAEKALLSFISQYAENHTVIVATHSPVLIQSATSIIVLEQGKVAIAGAANTVMEKLATQKNNNER